MGADDLDKPQPYIIIKFNGPNLAYLEDKGTSFEVL
jgi:hypothetical protein